VPEPDIKQNEILVRVKATGMCRTDVQLVDGYFRKYAESSFPLTPGHEIAGVVEKIGSWCRSRLDFWKGIKLLYWEDGATARAAIATKAIPRFAVMDIGLGSGLTAATQSSSRFPLNISLRLING